MENSNLPGDQPTLAGAGSGPVDLDRTLAAPSASASPGPQADMPRQRIGSYALVSRLGEGGMGVVYEAVQDNPRRHVALKIIRGGSLVDEHSVRMFQREAQVLARLQHPGIAAIYECGRTADGQHFLAMEMVHGWPLDAYLKRPMAEPAGSKVWVRRRLELFLKICDAVSYAHQRGVIHRDLKPANILVPRPAAATSSTIAGAAVGAEVKVLDFGLAHLAEDELGGTSLLTKPGTIQGTVPYMSPEQVRGSTDQVDVRSDVYALGVMLYEMLTGVLPYDLSRASLPEAARIICEQPPSALAAPNRRGGARGVFTRELAIIVNKSLEKEPDRRYQSVAALAEDVHRCLHDLPILAQPPTATYQFRKLVARHRAGFAFAAALVLLLAGFAATMAVDAHRISIQRDRANREAQVAGQVSGFLTNLFESSNPEQARGRVVTASELLDRGAGSIQGDRTMDPEVKAELLDTMGGAYSSLGLFAQSQPLLEAALGIRIALFGGQSLTVAQTRRDLGKLDSNRGDDRAAENQYQRALEIYQGAEGPVNADVAKLLNDLGTTAVRSGQMAAAQDYFQRALAMRIQLDGPADPDLIPIRSNLATIAYVRKDYAVAEDQFRQELALAIKVHGPDHPMVPKLTNNLGGVLFTEKKYAEAERSYSQALALNRKLLGNEHPEIGLDLANLAEARDAQGDLKGAEGDYRQALAILQPKVPPTDLRLRFVVTNLGSVLVREDTPAALRQAEPLLRAALAADQKALPAGAWDIADVESELGGCLLGEHHLTAAEPLLVGSLPTLRAKLGANDPATVTRALDRIVQLYQQMGRPTEVRRYQALRQANP